MENDKPKVNTQKLEGNRQEKERTPKFVCVNVT